MQKVKLRISRAAYDEIKKLLAEGGAHELIWSDGGLNMEGLVLVRDDRPAPSFDFEGFDRDMRRLGSMRARG